MKKLILGFLALALLACSALAQQPDSAALTKVISVLQQQRNQAMDGLASAEVRAMTLGEENAKLKAELDELKKQLELAREPKKD